MVNARMTKQTNQIDFSTEQKKTFRTNPRRFLWSTMSKLGNASHSWSIVVTLVKPRFFAIAAIGPWPLIRQCFLWNSVYIFNGLWDIITCSGETYESSTFNKNSNKSIWILEFQESEIISLLSTNVIHFQH